MTELLAILDTMDIPESRKDLTDWNLRWLLRNININNSNHPEINRAVKLLITLIK